MVAESCDHPDPSLGATRHLQSNGSERLSSGRGPKKRQSRKVVRLPVLTDDRLAINEDMTYSVGKLSRLFERCPACYSVRVEHDHVGPCTFPNHSSIVQP